MTRRSLGYQASGAHSAGRVVAWPARHPRFSFHFKPTAASWANQVKTWFGILSRQAIRRGSFKSVRALTAAIERFSRRWNAGASPLHRGQDGQRGTRHGRARDAGRPWRATLVAYRIPS